MPTGDTPATDIPATLKRSPRHAQQLWSSAHDSAVTTYGEGERAHRTAFAALKHEYEKVGDHWEEKEHRGPSDARAATGEGETAQGVDAAATKKHLIEIARRLEIPGRSTMSKTELVTAIQKANARHTRRSRQEETDD